MSLPTASGNQGSHPDTGTRLAYERTFLAHERTQMAWIRTALSLISFGFTISKFFEFLHEKRGEVAPLLGAQNIGVLMIVTGLLGLMLATMRHRQALSALRAHCPDLPRSEARVMAMFLTVLGIAALIATLVRN